MRIIAGKHRGRTLQSPPDKGTRPTASRTREALFNLLEHHSGLREAGFEGVHDCMVADICCGTGALGFEALSRGAAHVTFLDQSRPMMAAVKDSVAMLGEEEHCTLLCSSAKPLPAAPYPHQLILCDPPYHKELVAPILSSLPEKGWLSEGAILAIETTADEAPAFAPPYSLIDNRRYGVAMLWLAAYTRTT